MKNFFLITNLPKDPDLTITNGIAVYLRDRGGHVDVRSFKGQGKDRHTGTEEVPEDTDCIIVLGGDGTLMRAAADLSTLDIPLLGINLGTLGYLAEIDRASIYPALDTLLAGEYQIEKRMLLRGVVRRGEECLYSGIALNDIFVSREGKPRVITLRNYVNNAYLNEYRADGLIVATPTGSTGYSLSAGGPIIEPRARLFLMTPLAAHTLNARSVILPEESRIRIEVGEGRDGSMEHALASFDGEANIPLVTGDHVDIRKSSRVVRIVKTRNDSFFETLRKKMKDR